MKSYINYDQDAYILTHTNIFEIVYYKRLYNHVIYYILFTGSNTNKVKHLRIYSS